MRVSVSIITTQNYRENRLSKVMETWGKDVDDLIIVTDEYGQFCGKELVKACNDSSYESNPYKNVFAIKYMHQQRPDSDWFLILDDDTYLNYNNLLEKLSSLSTEEIQVNGFMNQGSYPPMPELSYASGGAGYFFNRKTLEKLKDMQYSDNFCRFADVCIGAYCKSVGIHVVHHEEFHPREPSYYGFEDEQIKRAVSFHYIFGEEMNRIYEIGEKCRS